MSFYSRETSVQDGQPIALYEFKWGNTFWRYTSADRDVVRPEGTYTAAAVKDSGMTQGGSAQNDFTVNAPTSLPIVDLFRSTPPSETIWLTVRRIHKDDVEAWIYWVGTVGNVKRVNVAEAAIICRSLLASFKRTGLRLCWTRSCPHFLYDSSCRVNPETHRRDAEVTSVSDGFLTVDFTGADPAQGHFDGGFVAWVANVDGTLERRGIERSLSPTKFKLFGSVDRLAPGLSVRLYPGCDLTATTCDSKFNNLSNFGGFEQMSGKSPFDGTPVF